MLISNQQNKQDGPLDWFFDLLNQVWTELRLWGRFYFHVWGDIFSWIADNIIPDWIKSGFANLATGVKIIFIVAVVGLSLKFIKVI